MSPLWILLEIRMIEMVVTPDAIRRPKLQLKLIVASTNQHPTFYWPYALPVAQTAVSKHRIKSSEIRR